MAPDAAGPLGREDILDAIEDALDDGAYEDAVLLTDVLLRRDADDAAALVLRGEALTECGRFTDALTVFRRVELLVPTWPDSEITQARVLMEMGRLDEAAPLAQRAVVRFPDGAAGHRTLAVVHELTGNESGACRHYERAHALDMSFALPFRVSDDVFAATVERSMATFPAAIRDRFQNLEVHLQDLPDPEHARDEHTPLSMLILGYFDGTPLNHRSLNDPLSDLPSHVFIFKKNHERICHNLGELRMQIDITLKHELGHFLGLDEDDMERLGLD